ncbi:ABATE domain-containing protein (plasmid) [Streptomyces sp. NBC_00257]|uniref:CGNR zinc finger domain-containing protein n=1 Tax=unclassified Streptomyces TaxID=2593676 RepID=UPI002256BD8B|nr:MULTISPECIES: ABATE domain-containing protein [unclassified Streptomyces]MCX4902250.1 ABATE domain-containing protein [Streptomyces sp. NBC_00892]MCX5434588.1 ABATE domain-containing protein [Streptomyces sp. NBC_00062]
MVTDDPHSFRFDCGATWLNLLATRGRAFSSHPVERLDSAERLADWLRVSELAPHRRPTHADLERTWQLRECLRALALATTQDRTPPDEAVAELGDFLAADDPVELTGGDRLRRSSPTTVGEALVRIARQAADHLTGADRAGLKVCPENDCRGVFTDPAGRRRWCPSPSCASRGRVRAHRARRAAP